MRLGTGSMAASSHIEGFSDADDSLIIPMWLNQKASILESARGISVVRSCTISFGRAINYARSTQTGSAPGCPLFSRCRGFCPRTSRSMAAGSEQEPYGTPQPLSLTRRIR